MMKARDLMIPVQAFLKPEDTLRHAVTLMKAAKRGEEKVGVNGLPVLDDAGKLVGMLSIRDVLRSVHPTYKNLTGLGELSWEAMLEEAADKIAGKHVYTLMSTELTAVREDSPIMDAVDKMIKRDIMRLPVVNKAGRVVGMLYERDVFFSMVKTMLEENTGGEK